MPDIEDSVTQCSCSNLSLCDHFNLWVLCIVVLSCLFKLKALDLCNVVSSISLIVLSLLPITGVLGPGIETSWLLQ